MRRLCLLALIPACLALPSEANSPPSGGYSSRSEIGALLSLDAGGNPVGPARIEDVPGKALPIVESALSALRFEPARRDGVAVASEVAVVLTLKAEGLAPFTRYEVANPRVSPVVADLPRYPAPAMMAGQGALVMVRIECGADAGAPTRRAEVVDSALIGRNAGRNKEAFHAAAAEAFRRSCQWVETIDGQPVVSVFHRPIRFFLSGQRIPDDKLDARFPAGEVARSDGLERARILPAGNEAGGQP